MPYLFAALISANKCTLKDIKNCYYLDDCLNILDIIQTDNYNESKVMDNIRKSRK